MSTRMHWLISLNWCDSEHLNPLDVTAADVARHLRLHSIVKKGKNKGKSSSYARVRLSAIGTYLRGHGVDFDTKSGIIHQLFSDGYIRPPHRPK